ncbi:MAG: zinc-binding dehydrogenase [Ardenticatenaceae bacterium]|nr:zinc-binding dehydrogenase [Ardenticatenaceae bacterium]
MKAVQILARGHADFVETPKPEIKPGHALVRTHRLSLCGSDVGMLHHFPEERYPLLPGTTGHEMIGYIEAIDAPGSPFKVGDMALTLAPDHRAMAEYYLAPIENVLPLPADKSVEELLQAQQIGTVIYACKTLPNIIGKDVAVIGQGSAGLWFNFMLRRMGAARIIALDLQAHRLQLSKFYGATHTVHNREVDGVTAVADITHGQLADIVIEASGEIEAINLAIDLAKEDGHILQFGVPRSLVIAYNYRQLFFKRLSLQTMVHAAREPHHTSTRMALNLIGDGTIDVKPILTHRFPFERVLEAYELHRTYDEGAIKIVIEMD